MKFENHNNDLINLQIINDRLDCEKNDLILNNKTLEDKIQFNKNMYDQELTIQKES